MDFEKHMTGFYMHSVCLPEEVTDYFKDFVGKFLEFRCSSGDTWRVGLIRSGDKLVLQTGWSEFASFNNILQEDLLHFKLVCGSTFEVRILDSFRQEKDDFKGQANETKVQETTTETTTSLHSFRKRSCSCSQYVNSLPAVKRLKKSNFLTLHQEEGTLSLSRSKKRSQSPDFSSLPSNKRLKISDCHLVRQEKQKSAFKVHRLLSQKKDESLRKDKNEVSLVEKVNRQEEKQLSPEFELLENGDWNIPIETRCTWQWKALSVEQKSRANCLAIKLQPGNPVFIHVLPQTFINSKLTCMNLPREFCAEHLQEGNQTFLLRQPESENTWSVTCSVCFYSNAYRRRIRGSSWLKFIQDNNLRKGDICLFELVKTTAPITGTDAGFSSEGFKICDFFSEGFKMIVIL